MSVVSRILSGLFQRYPRYQVSVYKPIYTALVTQLATGGITVGGKASYPRVEIHTIQEQQRQDKDGALRQINLTVESISDSSLNEAVIMNDKVLKFLTRDDLSITGWTCIGILPGQLQDLTETTDSKKILYRLMQEFVIFMEKVKTDSDDSGDDDDDSDETENETQTETENN